MESTRTSEGSQDEESANRRDILTVFQITHPRLGLTRTIEHDSSAFLRPIPEAGTDPTSQRYIFCVCSDDFDHFEAGLHKDATVREFEQVLRIEDTAVYALSYADDVLVFSTQIVEANGVVLDIRNDGPNWIVKAWLPDRQAARKLWDFAGRHGIEMDIERINMHSSILSNGYGLTTTQREALLSAFELGYFDEPRSTTLEELATELGVSQPAVSGSLRRGFRRLLKATVAEDHEGGDCLEEFL